MKSPNYKLLHPAQTQESLQNKHFFCSFNTVRAKTILFLDRATILPSPPPPKKIVNWGNDDINFTIIKGKPQILYFINVAKFNCSLQVLAKLPYSYAAESQMNTFPISIFFLRCSVFFEGIVLAEYFSAWRRGPEQCGYLDTPTSPSSSESFCTHRSVFLSHSRLYEVWLRSRPVYFQHDSGPQKPTHLQEPDKFLLMPRMSPSNQHTDTRHRS